MRRPKISLGNLENRLYSIGSFIKERPLEAVGTIALLESVPMILYGITFYISNNPTAYVVGKAGIYLGLASSALIAIGMRRTVKRKEREIQDLENKAQKYGYKL